jgi:hypothetical protein
MAVVLLAGSIAGADELKSGPQVGEQATRFGALFLKFKVPKREKPKGLFSASVLLLKLKRTK